MKDHLVQHCVSPDVQLLVPFRAGERWNQAEATGIRAGLGSPWKGLKKGAKGRDMAMKQQLALEKLQGGGLSPSPALSNVTTPGLECGRQGTRASKLGRWTLDPNSTGGWPEEASKPGELR